MTRYIERGLLVRAQQQLTLYYPFYRDLLSDCKLVVKVIVLSIERYFLYNIRFPANSVWVYMVPSQSYAELKVFSHSDVTIYLMLLNAFFCSDCVVLVYWNHCNVT